MIEDLEGDRYGAPKDETDIAACLPLGSETAQLAAAHAGFALPGLVRCFSHRQIGQPSGAEEASDDTGDSRVQGGDGGSATGKVVLYCLILRVQDCHRRTH